MRNPQHQATIVLDTQFLNVHTVYMKDAYSTQEVANAIGVNKKTLLRWLYAGSLPEPKSVIVGEIKNRIWTAKDLERARQYKEQNYRKRS
jgi:hypothetical protein